MVNGKTWLIICILLLVAGFSPGGCGGGSSSSNTAPVANAGTDRNVSPGSVVTLDGSGSSDADGDTLTYSWSFTSVPSGSSAVLSDTTLVNPTFTPDTEGSYVVSLLVNDGIVDSAADTVIVTAVQWITQTGTTDGDESFGIALDSSGNIYITGRTEGDLGGTGNAGGWDILIAKYDSTGIEQWITQIGTSSDDFAEGIAIDSSGNIYITGHTMGDLGGAGNAGDYDIYIAKYDSMVTEQWITQIGTSSNDFAEGIALDSSGNIYITGYTYGDLGSAGNAGSYDILIAKYDSTGAEQWITQIGTTRSDKAYGIAIDSSGNIYITGRTEGDLGGTGNAGGWDILIAKYDSTGTLQWITQIGTSSDDFAEGIALDSIGNIYVTGRTYGDLGGAGNAGDYDIYIAKYDSMGAEQWITQDGTTGSDKANGIALDSSGNIYITGHTMGDLGGTNAGFYDIFIAKYDSTITLQWIAQTGTTDQDYGKAIAIDSSDNAYITGHTMGELGGTGNAGRNDIFVSRNMPYP